MRAAGLPEGIIMKVGGWKTHAMFNRYAIINSVDLDLAVRRLEMWQRKVGLSHAVAENKSLRMPRVRGVGTIFQRKDSPFWWVCYWFKNKQYQESTKERDRERAQVLLESRIADIDCGIFIPERDRDLRARIAQLEAELAAKAS
jgi:hypothetical protein